MPGKACLSSLVSKSLTHQFLVVSTRPVKKSNFLSGKKSNFLSGFLSGIEG
jgi:hypothetical protein